jgi:hypothetical protein
VRLINPKFKSQNHRESGSGKLASA